MSVDNNAILFVGVRALEIDGSKIEGITEEEWEDDPIEAIRSLNRDDGLVGRFTDGYGNGLLLVGYEIDDSGSYGVTEVDKCAEKILEAEQKFFKFFGFKSKTYLFNYQW